MGDQKNKWWNSWNSKFSSQLEDSELEQNEPDQMSSCDLCLENTLVFEVKNKKIIKCDSVFIEWSGYSEKELLSKEVASYIDVPECLESILRGGNNDFEVDSIMNLTKKDGITYPIHWFITMKHGIQKWIGLPAPQVDQEIRVLQKQIEIQQSLSLINQVVFKNGTLKDILGMVIKKAVEIIETASHGSIMILDHNQYLKVFSTWGYGEEMLTQFKVPLVNSYIYNATKGKLDKISVIVHPGYEQIYEGTDIPVDYVSEQDFYYESTYLATTINAPIELNGQFYGCINLDTTNENGFTKFDLTVLENLRYQIELILENYQLYEQTAYLSKYDKLTDVYNRGYFEEQLSQMMLRQTPFLLVIFDLSQLKHVNDTYGHNAGDAYLKQFSKTLKTYFGMSVLLGRYGGDEFIGVFTGIERNELIRVIEVLYILFEKEALIVQHGSPLICKFHYGISEFPEEGLQLQELVSKAEKKLATQRDQH